MKNLLLLIAAVGCLINVSCSDATDSVGPNKPTSLLDVLAERFDFTDVDTNGLVIKAVYEKSGNTPLYPDTFISLHPNLAVLVGDVHGNAWVGLFDRKSGELKFQYTDSDRPASYSAYGTGTPFAIYSEDEGVALAMQYPKRTSGEAQLDLISFDQDHRAHRTAVADNLPYDTSSLQTIVRWIGQTLCFRFETTTAGHSVIYDTARKELLCCVRETSSAEDDIHPFYQTIGLRITNLLASLGDIYPCPEGHILLDAAHPLHSWVVGFAEGKVYIMNHQCTYSTATTTVKATECFESLAEASAGAAHYTFVYKTQTDNYLSADVSRIEADGTSTTKTVDVRLANDELTLEIQ